MMKTGKNNRFLASILAASMMLTMSPFAFAAEQKEMTTQEQIQSTTQNETNANPAVSQKDGQPSENTNSEALKTEGQSSEGTNSEASKTESQPPKDTNSKDGQPSENVNPADGDTNAGGSTSTSENAAKIGEKEYPTIAAAIAAADGSEPIVLLRHVTENITINKSLTLNLGGFTLSGSGDGKKTVVSISGKDVDVTIEKGTITGGNASLGGGFNIQSGNVIIDHCIIEKNKAQSGGGIYMTGSANVKVIGSEIINNEVSSNGGAIQAASGAVGNKYYNSVCEIVDTKLNNNTAYYGGAVTVSGAHFSNQGVTTTFIMDGESTMDSNSARSRGGAVYLSNNGARFLIKDGIISNNKGNQGGAIWAANWGGVTIEKGTLSNNIARNDGGAIYIKADIGEEDISESSIIAANFRDVLNLGDVLVTGNSAKQGGGIYIDSYNKAYGIKADLKQASIYNNHASVRADDIYSTGAGTEGCTVQLGETADSWKLDCGDTVDNWYIDSDKMGEGTARWNAHPEKGDIYAVPYMQRTGLKDVLTLKAAHEGLEPYTIEHYKYNPETKKYDLADTETRAAAVNTEVTAAPKNYEGYVLNPQANGYAAKGKVIKSVRNEDGTVTQLTLKLFYDPDTNGNDIPDSWEYRLIFKVVNGEWNNGGNADIVIYVPFKDKDGNAIESDKIVIPENIPAAGDKPNSGYRAGSWDTTPVVGANVAKDTIFTYTYAKRSSGGGGGSHKPTVTIPDDVPTGLNGDDHYAYIVGYPDSTVRPQNGITRAEVATIFFRLLTDETRNANSTKSNSYSDVAAGVWYNHAVSTLSAMGIVKGDSHGKFNPNAPITRAEFAAIAARFDDKANTTAVDFSDIATHWAKDEISAAANNGWINGYTDGTFRPNNKITRAEAMTLVNRVLKRLPETAEDLHNDMIKWSDNSDTSAWYYLAVQEATNSHYYDIKENKHEKWSKLRETRDWTELEK